MSPRSFALTATTSDYTVDVIGGSSPTPAPRGRKRIAQAFSALLIAMFLAMGGLLTSGSSANAAWIDGAVRGVLCSNIYFNTDPDSVWGGPNTTKGMPKDTSDNHGAVKGYEITAYEKYGVSGTNWTVWSGPDNADEMKNEGDMGGRQLVTLAGGDNKLDSWASMKDGPEDQRVFYNADESCGDPVNQGWTLAGNLIMSVNGAIVWLTGFVFQTAYESASSIIHSLDDTIVSVVETLTSALYFELFEVMVMLAALWMGYVGLVKRKSTQMAQGALWMFGAAFLGGLMLANPMAVSNTGNGVVAKVSETAISTISKTGVDPLSKDAQLCAVDEAGNSFAPSGEDKPDPVARGTVRVMQCSMWQNFMFNPWVIGQFGHAPGQADGIDYIAGNGETPGNYGHISTQTPVLEDAEIPTSIKFGDRDVPANWALLQLDSKVSYPGADNVEQGKHMLHIASAQTFEDAANPEWAGNRTWAGQSSLNRVMVAIISFIGLLGTAIMLVVISMEIIVLQIGLVILTLLAPIFALVAVHPGMGRRIGLMYVNTVVELALRRIVLSVMLAVMVAFYAAVIHASQSADWLVSMILMVAVSIGGILYKNKILQMFSGAVNMGGAGKMNMGDGLTDNILGKANQAGKLATLGAAGAALGITGAATAAGRDGATALVKKSAANEGSWSTKSDSPRPMQPRRDHNGESKADGAEKSEKDIASGARPMGNHEEQASAPISVVAEQPQDGVEEAPQRPAVQLVDQAPLEFQEEAEGVAPRPETEAGALPLAEDFQQDPEVEAGDRPAPLHSEAVAPAPTTADATPVAAVTGTGAAVAGARTATEAAPRPMKARHVLARRLAKPGTVRKGLSRGAATTRAQGIVKDPTKQAELRTDAAAAAVASRKDGVRTPVRKIPGTGASVSNATAFATMRAAIKTKTIAPVAEDAQIAPRKDATKGSRSDAGSLPEVQEQVVAAPSARGAAPAGQAPQGALPDLTVAAPAATAPAPQAQVAKAAHQAETVAPQAQASQSTAAPKAAPQVSSSASAARAATASAPVSNSTPAIAASQDVAKRSKLAVVRGVSTTGLKGALEGAKAAARGDGLVGATKSGSKAYTEPKRAKAQEAQQAEKERLRKVESDRAAEQRNQAFLQRREEADRLAAERKQAERERVAKNREEADRAAAERRKQDRDRVAQDKLDLQKRLADQKLAYDQKLADQREANRLAKKAKVEAERAAKKAERPNARQAKSTSPKPAPPKPGGAPKATDTSSAPMDLPKAAPELPRKAGEEGNQQ